MNSSYKAQTKKNTKRKTAILGWLQEGKNLVYVKFPEGGTI